MHVCMYVCIVCIVCMYCMPFLRCLARSGKAAKLRWHIHIRISASRCTCGALSYPCWNWQCFSSGVATNSNWVIGAPNCAKHVSIHEIAALSGWSIVRLASQHCSTRMDYGPKCSAHVCVQMWLKQGLANQLRLRSPPYHPYYYPYPSPEWSVHEWSCSCCGIWVSFGARRRAAWEAHEQEASFADRLWGWCASKRLLKRITPSMCTVQRWKMLSSGQLAATSPHLSPTAVQHGATWARLGASWA